VLSAACGGRLTADWREGKDLPEWEEKTLREVCSKFQYGTSQKSDKNGIVPVLRMGNIQNGKIDWNDLVYTSDEDDIKKFALKNGDILFNRTNSAEHVGKTAIFESEGAAIFAGYLIKIYNDKTRLNSWFLNYILNSLKAKEYCQMVKSDGVNQSNINAQKLADFVIPLPPLPEQGEIVRRVDKLFILADKIEDRYNMVKKQLERAEKAIYSKAFRGEL
jgi:type I restriction enzyme S subunit